MKPKYKRILLKLSGEALMGEGAYGISRQIIEGIVAEIAAVAKQDVEIGVVIGSRALAESHIERPARAHRRAGSALFQAARRLLVPLPGITDTQCGFKFFRAEAARDLFRRQRVDGYMFDVEILAIASRLGYEIREVPIRWRDDADSRLDLIAGNIRNVIDVLRVCASSSKVSRQPELARVAGERG